MGQRLAEILETSETLFSRKGYHDTSMQDLAEALGLQRGSLYAHIRSKEDLLYAIVERGADEFLRALGPLETSDLPPGERLQEALRQHAGVVARNLEAATVFFHEWKFLEGERRKKILAKRDAYEGIVRRILEDGVRKGVFRPHDTFLSATLVLSAGNWLYQWYRPDGSLTAEMIADQYATLLMSGLMAHEGGAS